MPKLYPHFQLSERLGAKALDIDAPTVRALLDQQRPRFGLEFDGELRAITILVNGRNIRYLRGLDTPLASDDEVAFIVPAGGG